MDSSVKYEKFGTSENDPKFKRFYQDTRFRIAGCTVAAITIAVVFAIVLAVVLTTQLTSHDVYVCEESTQVEADGLKVTTLKISEEALQGEYVGSCGGIEFQSTVNDSYIYLSVTTTSGEAVVTVLSAVNLSMTMMGASSMTFLVMGNQTGSAKYVDYDVPEKYVSMMDSIMMGQAKMSDDVLQLLNKTVNETRQSALENLAMSQETLLIIEAANALGDIYSGSRYPSLMNFYLLALQLSSARSRSTPKSQDVVTNSRRRRQTCTQPRHCSQNANDGYFCADQCSQNDFGGDVCAVESCPFVYEGRRYTNECNGLCGPDCCCWKSICDDCCLHTFCLTHDDCCNERGFYTWTCFAVLWNAIRGFSCSDIFDC